MAELQQLIQSIYFKGKPVDLGHLLESSFIEKADPVSPLLVLRFNDIDAIIREQYGIREQDELQVSIADPVGRDELSENAPFTVQSMKMLGNVLTVNCIHSAAHKLIARAGSARFFVGDSGLSVIKKLLQGSQLSFKSGDSAIVEDYHLLPQARPFELIRQICRETGKLAFIGRNGSFIYKSFSELLAEGSKSALEYHYRDSRQDNQIIDYKLCDGAWKAKDILGRKFVTSDMSKGAIEYGDASSATEYLGVNSKATLKALSSLPYPAVEMLMEGHGGLRPGRVIKTKWNKLQNESPIDESLPDTVMIGAVTHYHRANRYQCRAMGIVDNLS